MIGVVLVSLLAQCSFRAEWLRERETLTLPDGTPWGSVGVSPCHGEGGPRVKAQLFADGGVELGFHHQGVELELHARELFVTLAVPKDFGNGFTSGVRTELRIVAVEGNSVIVEPREREDAQLLGKWTQRRVDCGELKLGSVLSPGSSGAQLETAMLLFPRPGQPPAFRLAAGTKVNVKKRAGDGSWVSVALDDGATIDGWVRSSWSPSVGGSFTGRAICHRTTSPGRTCRERLPLFIRRDARVERIGTLDSETPFRVLSSDGTYLVIAPEAQFFALSDWWELVVAAKDLEPCSQVTGER